MPTTPTTPPTPWPWPEEWKIWRSDGLRNRYPLRTFVAIVRYATARPSPSPGGVAEFTRYGFARLLDARAVDIVQPDCCVTGGLSEFANVAMLATIHDIRCCPHIWGSAVALQTGLHAAFSLPDYPESLTPAPVWLEYDRQHQRAARGTEPEPYSHGRWLDRSAREAGTWV